MRAPATRAGQSVRGRQRPAFRPAAVKQACGCGIRNSYHCIRPSCASGISNVVLPSKAAVLNLSHPGDRIPKDIGLWTPRLRCVISQSGGRCCFCIWRFKENTFCISSWGLTDFSLGTPLRTIGLVRLCPTRNSLLSQKLCHDLNEVRTLNYFVLSKLKFDLRYCAESFRILTALVATVWHP